MKNVDFDVDECKKDIKGHCHCEILKLKHECVVIIFIVRKITFFL